MTFLLVAIATFVSFLVTGLVRSWAIRWGVLDVPTDRSSHVSVTPRGGGIAVVVVFSTVAIALWVMGAVSDRLIAAVIGGGLLIGLVGLVDDIRNISPAWRLLSHFIAAAWVLFCTGGMPEIPIFGVTLDLGWFGDGLALLSLVWLQNLYNFMDGINGIAGVEAITVLLGIYVVVRLEGLDPLGGGLLLSIALAGIVFGFLLWNFPRARIFLGDSGSGFLGIILGTLAVHMATEEPVLIWCWMVLLGVFVVDATWTLLRRLTLGHRPHEAHRTHAYQRFAELLNTHTVVSLVVGLINIFWLLPIAIATVKGWMGGAAAVVTAYAPLIVLVWLARAGKTSHSRTDLKSYQR